MDFESFKARYQKIPVEEIKNKAPAAPLVSVCVQTYQHARYIRKCLDSILLQKVSFEYEILLGDDESVDGTRDICLEYAELYPGKIRLFLHRRENNIVIGGGPTGRFNFLYNLFSTKGKYIALCEGDDYWTDSLKLTKQVDTIKITNSDCCNTLWQELRNDEVYDMGGKRCPEVPYYVLEKGKMEYFHLSTRFIRKVVMDKILNQYPKELMADTALQIILNQYYKVVILCEYTSVYRISEKGIWTGGSETFKNKMHYDIYKNLSKYIPERKYEFLKKKWRAFFLQLNESSFFPKISNRWINRMVRFLAYFENKVRLF